MNFPTKAMKAIPVLSEINFLSGEESRTLNGIELPEQYRVKVISQFAEQTQR